MARRLQQPSNKAEREENRRQTATRKFESKGEHTSANCTSVRGTSATSAKAPSDCSTSTLAAFTRSCALAGAVGDDAGDLQRGTRRRPTIGRLALAACTHPPSSFLSCLSQSLALCLLPHCCSRLRRTWSHFRKLFPRLPPRGSAPAPPVDVRPCALLSEPEVWEPKATVASLPTRHGLSLFGSPTRLHIKRLMCIIHLDLQRA